MISEYKEEEYKMNDQNSHRNLVALLPNAATCFNFVRDDIKLRKTAWLVPHVVKYKEDSAVISWRCNWGNVCESDCIYAMAKDKNEKALPLPKMYESV